MSVASARWQGDMQDVSAIVIEQADRLFHGEATKERLADADGGSWPAAIWRAVEQAGLPLALVPEARGGVGLAPGDALQLVRRAGYHTLPVPLPETMLAAALWAEAGGTVETGPASLAPVVPGNAIGIERHADGFVLSGRAARVPWATRVDRVLLHACDAAGTGYLALLPHGKHAAQALRNLANEPRDSVALDEVTLPSTAVRPAPRDCVEGFLPFGALARALQMVGAMERCLDYALEYAMQRHQFGRPIGKFQAVQHMLADAAGQYAAAAAAAELAVQAYGGGDFIFAAAIAKARAGEAAGRVAEVCHQVHGAIGFTQEHPLHFATRRLWSWRDEFGHETYWQERVGRAVCAAGGEALWPMLVGS